MTLIAVDKKETAEFISSADTGEQKTKFYIKPFSKRFRLYLSTWITRDKAFDHDKMSRNIFTLIKEGLSEIKCVQMPDGKMKNFSGDEIESALEMLPDSILGELFQKVLEFNELTEPERKN